MVVRSAIALVAAYLIGAVPVGYLVGRLFGDTDIRRHGSGNIGASNVLRTLGRLPAAITLIGDIAKGYAVVALAQGLAGREPAVVAAAAVLGVAGNCWPLYLGFRGGKGVATALGTFLRLMPAAVTPAALIWLVVVAISRYLSLGSILAAGSIPLMALLFGYDGPSIVASVVVAGIIVARHRDNVARLLSGTEHRLGQRASA